MVVYKDEGDTNQQEENNNLEVEVFRSLPRLD